MGRFPVKWHRSVPGPPSPILISRPDPAQIGRRQNILERNRASPLQIITGSSSSDRCGRVRAGRGGALPARLAAQVSTADEAQAYIDTMRTPKTW